MKAKNGFTLIELLVVIAIIGVLASLLLPAVQAARESARNMQCTSNLRQLGLALHNYHDSNRSFPAGWVGYNGREPDALGGPGWGWGAAILPFVEQGNLRELVDFSRPMTSHRNENAVRFFVPLFQCPSDFGAGNTFDIKEFEEQHNHVGPSAGHGCAVVLAASQYVAAFGTTAFDDVAEVKAGQVFRSDGVFGHNSFMNMSRIADGTSNTILLGERASHIGLATWAGTPSGHAHYFALVVATTHADDSFGIRRRTGNPEGFSSHHRGGSNFLLGDGSVRFISESINMDTLRNLTKRNSGEVIDF